MYIKCIEKRCLEINKPKLEDTQCGFRPGRSTAEEIFTLQQIFEKSWEYAKDICTCFVELEKVYDRVPREKLWWVLQEYGVDDRLLLAVKSLYSRSEVCVRGGVVKWQPFTVDVRLLKWYVLSPLLVEVYMNWIEGNSRVNVDVTVGSRVGGYFISAMARRTLANGQSFVLKAKRGFSLTL